MTHAILECVAFAPGDHLQVRRPLGYFHHGIYIGDSQAVQFGGGIFDKPSASIGIAPPEEFAKMRDGRGRPAFRL